MSCLNNKNFLHHLKNYRLLNRNRAAMSYIPSAAILSADIFLHDKAFGTFLCPLVNAKDKLPYSQNARDCINRKLLR
jgi:hypothetical protein